MIYKTLRIAEDNAQQVHLVNARHPRVWLDPRRESGPSHLGYKKRHGGNEVVGWLSIILRSLAGVPQGRVLAARDSGDVRATQHVN